MTRSLRRAFPELVAPPASPTLPTLAALSAAIVLAACQDGAQEAPEAPNEPADVAQEQPAAAPDQQDFRLRSDVEAALPARAEAFAANPNDDAARRAYADILFKLGDIWEADEVIAPLAVIHGSDDATEAAGESPFHAADLALAGRTAYLLGDYGRAEPLYARALEVAEPGSDEHDQATTGLALTYYQTNQFVRATQLPAPDTMEGPGSLIAFMQAFEGEPYGIEWASAARVTHLEMTNDIRQPGALPIVEIDVNGRTVALVLDTGGDRLYLDREVYAGLGLDTLTMRLARYAYTGGATVEEPLSVAESVAMGDVTLTNVPVVGATWKELGQTTDGVFTTQLLRQFLSTVDYDNNRITLRERAPEALAQVMETFGDAPPVAAPFYMSGTHLMFAKGSLNGHEGINYFVDSGLAMSMPMIVVDETVELLGLETNAIEGQPYFWTPIESHGLNGLVRGATQALGNVFVEDDPFWQSGFMMDMLISHQYLWPLGSWTIDFDNMTFHFPAQGEG